jgi:integrase/recombinase XerC
MRSEAPEAIMTDLIKSGASPLITLPASPGSLAPGLNIAALLLQDQRVDTTRRAYKAALKHFFEAEYGAPPDAALVRAFLAQSAPQLALQLATYRNSLRADGRSPATINLRLAAIRSLLTLGHRLGYCAVNGQKLIDSEKQERYRDTRGTDLANLRRLIALPDRSTLRGKRDLALLRLLCENALRREETCALDVCDFEGSERRIAILGKGKTQKSFVTIRAATVDAIRDYLLMAGHTAGPLFLTCDRRPHLAGARLRAGGLYAIVAAYGKQVDLTLAPHKLRHSAITAALDATGGDIRRVQKLSRHADIRTLSIYDDNRSDQQGEITAILGDLLDG